MTEPRKMDDCWNRIGVWAGRDRTCPELEEYIHCHNCPVYTEAGRSLLDQPAPGEGGQWARGAGQRQAVREGRTDERMMVFRLGAEWFGLSLEPVREVLKPTDIHRLPHRPDPAVLGVANIKGDLTVVVSLAELLGVSHAGERRDKAVGSVFPRLVVVGERGRGLAFPVDEVSGIQRFQSARLGHVPGTLDAPGMSFVSGLIHLDGRTIGVLNHDRLLPMLEESLR